MKVLSLELTHLCMVDIGFVFSPRAGNSKNVSCISSGLNPDYWFGIANT